MAGRIISYYKWAANILGCLFMVICNLNEQCQIRKIYSVIVLTREW